MPIYDPYGRPLPQEDLDKLYQESDRKIQEHTRAMTEGMKKVIDTFEKSMVKMSTHVEDQMEKYQQNFLQLAGAMGRTLSETMNKSMRMGIPSSLGAISPLFGAAGEQLGSSAGMSLAKMLGKGGVWGAVAQVVGKELVGEIGMQVEGFRMIGARVAPVATGGQNLNIDFDKIGAEYTRSIRNVGRSTGATADEVADLADKLSKVGVGFLQGGERHVQFALAAERTMNLTRGTASALQIDTVTKYGDSLKSARAAINDIRDAQREFIAINWQTNSSISRTLSSGQTLVDLLGQISASGRNSGASLRDMNNLATALVKTMSTQPGGPMFRPGQMAEVGGNIMQTILPSMSATMQQEAQKSKIDELIMGQTSYGRQVMKVIQQSAPAHLQSASGNNFLFNMQQQAYSSAGNRGAGMRIALAKLTGIHKIFETYKQEPASAYALLEQQGYTPAASAASMKLMEDLKARGLNPDDPSSQERILKDYLKETQRDPRIQEQIKKAGLDKDILSTADEQGKAMLSSMENIANILMDVRLWTHDYWNNWKNSTAEIFGLNKNAPWYQTMGAALGLPGAGVGPAAVAAGGAGGGFSFLPGAGAPKSAMVAKNATSTSSMVLTRQTAKASKYELETRDVGTSPD